MKDGKRQTEYRKTKQKTKLNKKEMNNKKTLRDAMQCRVQSWEPSSSSPCFAKPQENHLTPSSYVYDNGLVIMYQGLRFCFPFLVHFGYSCCRSARMYLRAGEGGGCGKQVRKGTTRTKRTNERHRTCQCKMQKSVCYGKCMHEDRG